MKGIRRAEGYQKKRKIVIKIEVNGFLPEKETKGPLPIRTEILGTAHAVTSSRGF